MSDPLSAASSIVGIVSLGLTVTSGLLQYYSAWKDFDNDVRQTFALIQTLKDLLNAAQSTTSSLGARSHSTVQDQAFVLIRTAQESLLDLQRRWEKLKAREPKSNKEIKHEALSRLNNHRKRLLYPLRQGTLGKLRDSALEAQDLVTRALQLLNIEIADSSATDIAKLRIEVKDWRAEEQNRKALNWLSTLGFQQRLQELLAVHCPGTGKWFEDLDEYNLWCGKDAATPRGLWCCGKMGSGKSVLMAVLTDNLQQLLCLPDEVILYSFCDWQDAKTHSPLLILGSLTRQLAESCTSTSDAVLDAFNDNRQGQAKLSLEDLFNLFAQLSFGFRKIFIVLDALDECDGGARGMETVNSPVVEHLLCRILDLGSHISVAISSRFAPSIRVPSGVFQTVHVKALPNDLELFANRELASMKAATRWTNPRLQKAVQEDRKLRGEVAQKCATSAGDIFLLAKLHLNLICSQLNMRSLRKLIEGPMPGLGDSVDVALERVESQDPQLRDIAHSILLWLCLAARPLKMQELAHGIAVIDGDQDFDGDGLIPSDIMLTSCAGLVEMDLQSSIIRLVHLSVRQHIEERRLTWLEDGHLPLLQATTTYLGFNIFNDVVNFTKDDFISWTTRYPLLSYAVENWTFHCQGIPLTETTRRVMNLLSDTSRAQFLLRAAYAVAVGDPSHCPTNITELHIVAFYGLDELIEAYIETDDDIEATDSFGRKPLFLAAARGHDQVVERLLKLGAHPGGRTKRYVHHRECADLDWRIPSWARVEGNESALGAASEAGFRRIVSCLLQAGALTDEGRGLHGSALEAAVFKGHVDIVNDLLPHCHTISSELNTAVYRGDPTILRALTQKMGATNDPGENSAQHLNEYRLVRALYAAAVLNRTECAKVLMEHGALPHKDAEGFYRTPLQVAAAKGSAEMVTIFLKTADVNEHAGEWINPEDKLAHLVLYNKLDSIPDNFDIGRDYSSDSWDLNGYDVSLDDIKLYGDSFRQSERQRAEAELETEGIDPSIMFRASAWRDRTIYSGDMGRSGRHGSALQAAAFYGQEDIVETLLNYGANVNVYTGYYGTALQAASAAGHLGIVKKLIDKGAHINTLSGFHGNPLTAAASGGHGRVTELLLHHGARINARGGEYGTALTGAARNQSKDLVTLLLDKGADPTIQAGVFGHPLQAASIGVPHASMCREAEDYAQEEISGCKNFEEMEDYYQARRDSFIYSNIHTIGIFGHMLQKVAGGAFGNTMEVFTSRFEGPGDEALGEILSDFWQDCQVSVDIVNLLLDKGAEVNVRGGLNGTALRAAIAAKRLPVVKALIKRGSDINERWPIHGRVPLSTLELALRHRSSEAASFLMDQPTFDMEQCIQNTFALHEAARTSPIIVSRLLACGATVDRQNNSGDTPLHCAVREKNIESARRLIEAGADVNAMTYSHSPFDGKTTLEQSENFDHEEMFRLLIESGASATSQTSALKAILMEFRQKFAYKRIKTTQKSIIGLLIEGMADINAGIDWSAREGTPEFIHSFASYRPFFILLMLTQPEDLDVYRLFLDSPNFRFSDQSTNFLWCAARENLLGVVQLLLDYGAIPTHEMAQDIENHALRRQCFSFSPTLTEEEQRDRSLEHRSKIIQLLK